MKGIDETTLVEVFTGSPWEAELTKGLLESNGIPSVMKDGILDTLAPYIGTDVSLLVNENDYEGAKEVIRNRKDKEKEAE